MRATHIPLYSIEYIEYIDYAALVFLVEISGNSSIFIYAGCSSFQPFGSDQG